MKGAVAQPTTLCGNCIPWADGTLAPLAAELQAVSVERPTEWSREHRALTFVSEAFDGPRKGAPDPSAPSKHWDPCTVGRSRS